MEPLALCSAGSWRRGGGRPSLFGPRGRWTGSPAGEYLPPVTMGTHVFYHRDCLDGFGAAWAAWKSLGDEVRYSQLAAGSSFPQGVPSGSRVFILDLGFPRRRLLELAGRMAQVVVIDHHATWEEEMAGLPFVHFSRDHSAAILAWQYWYPGTDPPRLLRHVEDEDLGRWELPGSREITAALESYPADFELWEELELDRLREEGRAIRRHIDVLVDRMVRHARWDTLAGHEIPVANATSHASEVAMRLLEEHPDAPFAGVYWETRSGDRRWSLRSRGDFDVGELASRLGGGGHPAAAGFIERLDR